MFKVKSNQSLKAMEGKSKMTSSSSTKKKSSSNDLDKSSTHSRMGKSSSKSKLNDLDKSSTHSRTGRMGSRSKSNNDLDKSSTHSRTGKTSSRSKSSNNDLDASSSHSRTGGSKSRNKSKKSKTVRVTGIDALLEKHNNGSSSIITTPLDEISISSDISARSNATEITMTSRGSRVSTVSKLPDTSGLGRSGTGQTFGRQSSYRSVHSHNSSACGSILQPDHSMALDHNHIVTVTQLWQSVKKMDRYKEDIPEQCILRMLELDPETRKNLRLPSLRSPRYNVVAKALLQIIEDIISVLGPDLEEFIEEVCAAGDLCAQEGINPKLLGEATAAGMALLLPDDDFRPEKKQVWKTTFDFLATKMDGNAVFGF